MLDRADDGRSIVSWRMLLVERVVLRSRRHSFRPDGLRHWRVRLLCKQPFAAADELADYHADRRTDGRSDGFSDERANGGADSATDRAANVNADGPSVSSHVHDSNRCSGGGMRIPRWHLLHW